MEISGVAGETGLVAGISAGVAGRDARSTVVRGSVVVGRGALVETGAGEEVGVKTGRVAGSAGLDVVDTS